MKIVLLALLAFTGLTATLGGLILIADNSGAIMGMSTDLLSHTLFNSFLLPGVVLTLVGSIHLAAVFTILQNSNRKYTWSLAAGILILAWIITQMIMIRAFHWLQFVYLFTGLLTTLLSYQLKGKWVA